MSKCANCGWDWFKHGSKNQCRGLRPDPVTGKKPRFVRAKREEYQHDRAV